MDQGKNSCYLCQMFKTVLIFSFGVIVGLVGGVVFSATL